MIFRVPAAIPEHIITLQAERIFKMVNNALTVANPVAIAIIFVIYGAIMLFMGAMQFKKSKSLSDFVLGGRQLNPWVTAMSAQASDMSGWLLMGLPGLAYLGLAGSSEAFWTALGLAVGTLLNWLFVAKRLRTYTEVAGDSITIPDYFENRFKDKGGKLRMISAIILLVFFIVYTAAQFSAGASLFTVVFGNYGLTYTNALFIGAIVIIAYTFLGGFLAVCWTDFIQGILMFVAIVVVPIIAMTKISPADATALLTELKSITSTESIGVMGVVSAIAWGLGYFGMPHILVRFMGIRSPKEVRPATIIAMIWVIISLIGAILVGIVGKFAVPSIGDGNQEKIFMAMCNQYFPTVIVGVLLSAILAAVMSTADSMLLVASSAFSGDIHRKLKPNMTKKQEMWSGRIAVLVVSALAILIATDEKSLVFELVSKAWAGFGSAFGPIILLSLYWKRVTLKGAVSGIVSGAVVSLFWAYKTTGLFNIPWLLKFPALSGGLWDMYEIIPGFLISLILIIVVSLLDKEPSQEIKDEFELVKVKIKQ